MNRGPYSLETKGMDLPSRIAWWNSNGGEVSIPHVALSPYWKKALRQDWKLNA